MVLAGAGNISVGLGLGLDQMIYQAHRNGPKIERECLHFEFEKRAPKVKMLLF